MGKKSGGGYGEQPYQFKAQVMRTRAKPVTAEYIIDAGVQDRAISIVKGKQFRLRKAGDRLLAGLLFCPCGSKLMVKRAKTAYYVCTQRYVNGLCKRSAYTQAQVIEGKVWADLPGMLEKVFEWVDGLPSTSVDRLTIRIRDIEKKIGGNDRRLQRIAKRMVLVDSAKFKEMVESEVVQVEEESLKLGEEKEGLLSQYQEMKTARKTKQYSDAGEFSRGFMGGLEGVSIEDRRDFLSEMFGSFEIQGAGFKYKTGVSTGGAISWLVRHNLI